MISEVLDRVFGNLSEIDGSDFADFVIVQHYTC